MSQEEFVNVFTEEGEKIFTLSTKQVYDVYWHGFSVIGCKLMFVLPARKQLPTHPKYLKHYEDICGITDSKWPKNLEYLFRSKHYYPWLVFKKDKRLIRIPGNKGVNIQKHNEAVSIKKISKVFCGSDTIHRAKSYWLDPAPANNDPYEKDFHKKEKEWMHGHSLCGRKITGHVWNLDGIECKKCLQILTELEKR